MYLIESHMREQHPNNEDVLFVFSAAEHVAVHMVNPS